MSTENRLCWHSDESFERKDRRFTLALIEEGKPGYWPANETYPTLAEAQAEALRRNRLRGLSEHAPRRRGRDTAPLLTPRQVRFSTTHQEV